MGKLYPPVIEGTLPAFYSENGVVKITIPFFMNRAVSYSQVGGFELRIKTVQNGSYLYTVQTYNPAHYELEDSGNLHVTFYLDDKDNKLKIGQFYKIQLAYIYIDEAMKKQFLNAYYAGFIDLDTFSAKMKEYQIIGYYSDAAVAKYTTKPKLYINNLRKGFINAYTNSYTGCYDQTDQDITEKVYTYRFDVYTEEGLCWSSGELLHNSSLDTNVNFSQDLYELNIDVIEKKVYYIQYTITTNNGLTLSTSKYKLMHRELIGPQLNVDLIATLNFDNGYIDVSVKSIPDDYGLPKLVTGAFILLRADKDSAFSKWEEMTRFKLNNENPKDNTILFRDCLFEQGKTYIYALQQYSDNNLYSSKIYSNEIVGDFEDAFLFDGKRQLKLRYNPKMTKFTNTRLEQKQDTIGGKYPFIFRNGQVNYHEFPIGGLISYFMDEANLFLSKYDLITEEKTIDYTTENLAQERLFKMSVLEWLNNGQPKVFRSPEEGNFIIRLLKISLSPENKLGRLLHNFNGTAYEIADYTHENLRNLGFLSTGLIDNTVLSYGTLELKDYQPDAILNSLSSKVLSARFSDMIPGEKVLITFADNTQETIVIGKTGNYFLENLDVPISSIVIPKRYERVKIPDPEQVENYYVFQNEKFIQADLSGTEFQWALMPTMHSFIDNKLVYYQVVNNPLTGLLTYSYETTMENTFEGINKVEINDCTIKQFIGNHNIYKAINNIDEDLDVINPREKVIDYYQMRISVRPVEKFEFIEADMIKYFSSEIQLNTQHPFTLYYNITDNRYYDFNAQESEEFYNPYIIINGEKIVITHDTTINLEQIDNIYQIESGNGVVVEIIYQTRITDYLIEYTNELLFKAKTAYESAVKDYEEKLNYLENEEDMRDPETIYLELSNAREAILDTQKSYLNQLVEQMGG